ncbi:hypothetical protein SAMD00019534_123580 [Acytostelium subglobosum LB1]|uniref:hypothetical protein n=1 Tax=Acytostelium subglobosum LB1 TaxID=1410327 RepID=UPI00064494B4|nr:hypothetical protein SAMD00019534_123580 [Acytostelium subglobosum LB1]GAM29182.1 hypothetical protein SAMD00019534_123580 [Acytostelium subglobosum LB1]|eukprot:XP_012747873.1 hypothetical protein SAMD00019534_123580 [Acytostelium subglobosum LB1]
MGERKVISKYYPPDFDPSKIPRAKGVKKSGTIKVVMMLPMSIRCNTCGEYIGRGTKFNSRKETLDDTYLGIKIFRFYLRCKRCAAELAIKTDPKNSDYVCESGATRNYEPWKETEEERTDRTQREDEEKNDAMKALENRTVDSKREMEIMDALDELRNLNSKNAEIDHEQLLEYSLKKQEEMEQALAEQDEQLIKETFGNKSSSSSTTLNVIKRIDEMDGPLTDDLDNFGSINGNGNGSGNNKKPKTSILGAVKLNIVKTQSNNNNGNKRKTTDSETVAQQQPTKSTKTETNSNSLASLFQYGSDEEDEE